MSKPGFDLFEHVKKTARKISADLGPNGDWSPMVLTDGTDPVILNVPIGGSSEICSAIELAGQRDPDVMVVICGMWLRFRQPGEPGGASDPARPARRHRPAFRGQRPQGGGLRVGEAARRPRRGCPGDRRA